MTELPTSLDGRGLPPRTQVFADADTLVRIATDRIVAALASAAGPRVALCLSGGSTPKAIYEALAGKPPGAIDWARLHLFWGDERLIAPDHADSNEGMARHALIDRVPIPAANLHPIVTSGRSAAEAAQAYEAVLKAFYGADRLSPDRALFDVTLLGLGEDGHTASLFPGQAAIDETLHWTAAVAQAGQPPYVPRITLTRPALAASRTTLVLVTGQAKHGPLIRIGAGARLPAGIVADESGATWLVDAAAATGPTG